MDHVSGQDRVAEICEAIERSAERIVVGVDGTLTLKARSDGLLGVSEPWLNCGAGGGGRTLMGRSPRDFESRASASFTTPASSTSTTSRRGCREARRRDGGPKTLGWRL